VYFNSSPLVAFNSLDLGKIVTGNKQSIGYEKAIFGFAPMHLPFIENMLKAIENAKVAVDDLLIDESAETVESFGNYYHYAADLPEKQKQIESFFGRYYYREMGEMYTMVSLWTPDKWHLEEKDLPEELL